MGQLFSLPNLASILATILIQSCCSFFPIEPSSTKQSISTHSTARASSRDSSSMSLMRSSSLSSTPVADTAVLRFICR